MADIKKIIFYSAFFLFMLSGCAVPRKHVPVHNKLLKKEISVPAVKQTVEVSPSRTAPAIASPSVAVENFKPLPAIPEKKIKIGIVQNARSVTIGGPSGGIMIFDTKNGIVSELPGGASYIAQPSYGGITLADKLYDSTIRIASKTGIPGVVVNGQKYRGTILLLKNERRHNRGKRARN